MQLTELAHDYLERHIRAGELAIDATSGNGHDTLKLAQLTGSTGTVIAIDLQAAAIEATKTRLKEADLSTRCTYLKGDHAELLQQLTAQHTGAVAAITFNLGYLPGSDKQIQTIPASTLSALDASLQLLNANGVLLVTAYRGHPGGEEEALQVASWMLAHKDNGFLVESFEPVANRIPPILWVLIK